MKNNTVLKKVICLVIVVGIVCTSFCVMTSCGTNKTYKDFYENDGATTITKSHTLKKGVSYVIEIDDLAKCRHDLDVSIDGEMQEVAIEEGRIADCNGLSAECFENKEVIKIGNDSPRRYLKGTTNRSYRISVTPSKDCTITYVLTRRV